MISLLPPNSTQIERAVEAATARIFDVDAGLHRMWNPERCPAKFLPWLASALSVDEWADDWTEARQREVIAASVELHRHKGTIGAVRRALRVLGYGDCDIIEGAQTMVGGGWVVGNDPAPYRDFLTGQGNLALDITRASGATYTASSGELITAPANVARIDCDPATGAPIGLLVEPQGTNFHSRSSHTAGSPWPTETTSGGITAVRIATGMVGDVPYADYALSGTTTGSSAQPFLNTSSSITDAAPGEAWTASVYVQLLAGEWPQGAAIGPVLFEFQFGSLRAEYNPVLIPSPLVQRSEVVGVMQDPRTNQVRTAIRLVGFSAAAPVAFDGVVVRLFGLQLERGNIATSLIQTTGSPKYRAADVLTFLPSAWPRDIICASSSGPVTISPAKEFVDAAEIGPAHLHRVTVRVAPSARVIDMSVGGAAHWAEYWLRLHDPIAPDSAASIARRLDTLAPAHCKIGRLFCDALSTAVGGSWSVGDATVPVGTTYEAEYGDIA